MSPNVPNVGLQQLAVIVFMHLRILNRPRKVNKCCFFLLVKRVVPPLDEIRTILALGKSEGNAGTRGNGGARGFRYGVI